jgi:hypothetical protein
VSDLFCAVNVSLADVTERKGKTAQHSTVQPRLNIAPAAAPRLKIDFHVTTSYKVRRFVPQSLPTTTSLHDSQLLSRLQASPSAVNSQSVVCQSVQIPHMRSTHSCNNLDYTIGCGVLVGAITAISRGHG